MKALVGSWEQRPHRLLAEAAALRTRVEDLQQALQRAHDENDQLRAALARALDQGPANAGQHDDIAELLELHESEQVVLSGS